MAIALNRVQLVGRLTKDPELRKTQSNTSVCQFTLAVNRDFKPEGGPEADFITCIAWRQSADYLTQYAHKGDLVCLYGRIQTRTYEDKDKKKVYVTEVLVEHLSIESKPGTVTAQSRTAAVPKYEPEEEYDDNFSNTPSLDISSDDLPFY